MDPEDPSLLQRDGFGFDDHETGPEGWLENTVIPEAVYVVAVFFDTFRDLPAREANVACRAGPTQGRWVGGRSGRRGEQCLGWLGFTGRVLDDPFRTPDFEDLRLVISVGV